MRVLVGCEESQAVCKAFRELGHEAYSCDLQPCSGGHPEWHLQMDVFHAIRKHGPWDLGIFFPPCTYLSSVQTFRCRIEPRRVIKRVRAANFFMRLYNCGIPKVGIENPTGVMSHIFREPDQIVHPFYFGDTVMKRTGLWLRGLPKLRHAKESDLFEEITHGVVPPPVKNWIQKSTGKTKYQRQVNAPFLSSIERSKLSPFIARAMAEQWGGKLQEVSNG